MKIQEIRELIRLVDQSTLSELEFEENGTSLKLRKEVGKVVVETPVQAVAAPVQTAVTVQEPVQQATPVVQQAQPVAPVVSEKVQDANLKEIKSPMVGTFYISPSPDQPAYVKVGDKVSDDTVVCIVEAMKLFNEIEAELTGEVVEVLAENGQLVEYGQPLFRVRA
ncbi:MAG: acetyl-CoA carboxylase biotin carboxyl carrier protein [Bacillaceae bacterium]